MNRYFLSALSFLTALVLPIAANAAEHPGGPAAAKAADRTVIVKPGTKYINAERGNVITVVYGDKSFTWKFDTFGAPNVVPAEIAPRCGA